MKIHYSNPTDRPREIAACRRLRAVWRPPSVASFIFDFFPGPLRLERKLNAESVGYFTHFQPVYSPDLFAFVSGRKLTRKVIRQAIERMATSPPLLSLHTSFTWVYGFFLGKRLTRVFLGIYGCEKSEGLSI